MVTKSELDGKNLKELKSLCKKHSIKGYSKLKKAELVKLVLKFFRKQSRSTEEAEEKKTPSCTLPENCASNDKLSDQDIMNIASSCGIQVRDPDTGTVMSRTELCAAISTALTKPPAAVNCKKYKKTKEPKCNDQPGCSWKTGQGCLPKSDVVVEPVVVEPVVFEPVVVEGKTKDCGSFKKTKEPKCNDQPGCSWKTGQGCLPKSDSSDNSSDDNSDDECSHLINMKVKELRELLKKAGITKGLPTNKNGLIDYACAINDRCGSKFDGKLCDAGNVCDEDAGVCLTPKAAKKVKKESMVWNGRTVIGTKTALKKLKKLLEQKQVQQPVVEENEDCGECKSDEQCSKECADDDWTCGNEGKCVPPVVVEPPVVEPVDVRPPEGTNIHAIEEILRKIEDDDKEKLEDLSEIQREVLSCLGLLGAA